MKEGFRLDRERDAFLRSRGFSVLRYWNSDVDRNLNGVMGNILKAMNERDPHPDRLPPVDPPRKGEGCTAFQMSKCGRSF
jgi:hypothetical protein